MLLHIWANLNGSQKAVKLKISIEMKFYHMYLIWSYDDFIIFRMDIRSVCLYGLISFVQSLLHTREKIIYWTVMVRLKTTHLDEAS